MDRRSFLNNLTLVSGGVMLPGMVMPEPEQQPVKELRFEKIYENSIRGLCYYDFDRVKHRVQPGDKLHLYREPENPYDRYAVEVFWGDYKLGYLPRGENKVLFSLLSKGIEYFSTINYVNLDEFNTFDEVSMEVYMKIAPNDAEATTKTKRMERYVEQLKEDLQQAASSASVKAKSKQAQYIGSSQDEACLAEVDEFIKGSSQTIADIIGIEQHQLPPLEKLTLEQVDEVYEELLEVFLAFNYHPDFPEEAPTPTKYRLLREKLHEKHPFLTLGACHLEFCNYEPESCPFPGEVCRCKEVLDDLVE